MKVKVCAKLNLTLNVLGKLDGFHSIDSVATSVDVFDVVEVVPRADRRVTVSGLDRVSTLQNTAYRAACAFIERFGSKQPLSGVDIVIEKGIPMGAGMGGSSADAAAVIYALCALFNVDVGSPDVHALCAELGSDVNYMLRGGLARLRGKGDDVECVKLGGTLYFALTTFSTSMSTAEVYSQYDKLNVIQAHADNGALMDELRRGVLNGVLKRFNNHLQAAAASLSDYACDYLQLCKRQGLTPNMTGSGSAYYVAFASEQSAVNACNLLNAHGFATVLCRSVPHGITSY